MSCKEHNVTPSQQLEHVFVRPTTVIFSSLKRSHKISHQSSQRTKCSEDLSVKLLIILVYKHNFEIISRITAQQFLQDRYKLTFYPKKSYRDRLMETSNQQTLTGTTHSMHNIHYLIKATNHRLGLGRHSLIYNNTNSSK